MKYNRIIGITILFLIGVGILPATRDAVKWQTASSNDNAQDYADYLSRWPDGRHANEARARFDERSWRDAQEGERLEHYEEYVQTHPNGAYLAEARTRIEELMWHRATKVDTIESLNAYLKSYNTGRFAGVARTRIEDLEWERCTRNEMIEILEGYLKNYENGRFAAAARTRIEDLMWEQATKGNTIRLYRGYADAYPKGKFVEDAEIRQTRLRTDNAPYIAALGEHTKKSLVDFRDTETALTNFLAEFPAHTREADARKALEDTRQTIKDITEGGDIVDLLSKNKVKIEAHGTGFSMVNARVRRLTVYPLIVRVLPGTWFVSSSEPTQNMVTTEQEKIELTDYVEINFLINTAFAKLPKQIPVETDTFIVQRLPQQAELAKLMPFLGNTRVNSDTEQAAVWILNNVPLEHFRYLVEVHIDAKGNRSCLEKNLIGTTEIARAIKLCDEAGIDITHKPVWSDKERILRDLADGHLKKWLEEKQ